MYGHCSYFFQDVSLDFRVWYWLGRGVCIWFFPVWFSLLLFLGFGGLCWWFLLIGGSFWLVLEFCHIGLFLVCSPLLWLGAEVLCILFWYGGYHGLFPLCPPGICWFWLGWNLQILGSFVMFSLGFLGVWGVLVVSPLSVGRLSSRWRLFLQGLLLFGVVLLGSFSVSFSFSASLYSVLLSCSVVDWFFSSFPLSFVIPVSFPVPIGFCSLLSFWLPFLLTWMLVCSVGGCWIIVVGLFGVLFFGFPSCSYSWSQ